ncbi:MAG: hypothetical protein ABJG42_24330 [Vibrio splendidus]
MLKLTHKVGDELILADNDGKELGRIVIDAVKNGQVKLSIDNDQTRLLVYRKPLWDKLKGDNNAD